MRNALAVVSLASLLVAPSALGQERGTTTGPEGSEIGKGGYEPASSVAGSFSIRVEGGGAFPVEGSFDQPFFVGGTASYWVDDFYRLDVSGAYIPTGNDVGTGDDLAVWEALVGPSFHFLTYTVGLTLGVQAGVQLPSEGDEHFLISPRVGLDFLPDGPLLLGFAANYDWAVDDNDASITRAYLSLGVRF
jgi:hypothetical protein